MRAGLEAEGLPSLARHAERRVMERNILAEEARIGLPKPDSSPPEETATPSSATYSFATVGVSPPPEPLPPVASPPEETATPSSATSSFATVGVSPPPEPLPPVAVGTVVLGSPRVSARMVCRLVQC